MTAEDTREKRLKETRRLIAALRRGIGEAFAIQHAVSAIEFDRRDGRITEHTAVLHRVVEEYVGAAGMLIEEIKAAHRERK